MRHGYSHELLQASFFITLDYLLLLTTPSHLGSPIISAKLLCWGWFTLLPLTSLPFPLSVPKILFSDVFFSYSKRLPGKAHNVS